MRLSIKLMSLFLLLLSPNFVFAQDIIVKRDGSTILAKVTEVFESVVKYKKHNNLDGPVYTVLVSDLLSINYENGTVDSFSDGTNPAASANNQKGAEKKYLAPQVANCNSEEISRYNNLLHLKEKKGYKPSEKNAKVAVCKYGVTQNSVLQNEDLKIKILGFERRYNCCQYAIMLENTSDSTIFIDLANTFRVEPNGDYHVYYDNKRLTVSRGTGVYWGFGISTDYNTTHTYVEQRVLSLPPLTKHTISNHRQIGSNEISHGEDFDFVLNLNRGIVKKNAYRSWEENDSPYKRKYIITYSKDQTFQTSSSMTFELFLQQIIGRNFIMYDEDSCYQRMYIKECVEESCDEYMIIGKEKLRK